MPNPQSARQKRMRENNAKLGLVKIEGWVAPCDRDELNRLCAESRARHKSRFTTITITVEDTRP